VRPGKKKLNLRRSDCTEGNSERNWQWKKSKREFWKTLVEEAETQIGM
jgi:uncharacterized membrane protein